MQSKGANYANNSKIACAHKLLNANECGQAFCFFHVFLAIFDPAGC